MFGMVLAFAIAGALCIPVDANFFIGAKLDELVVDPLDAEWLVAAHSGGGGVGPGEVGVDGTAFDADACEVARGPKGVTTVASGAFGVGLETVGVGIAAATTRRGQNERSACFLA
jgi:hypothetical protein